MSANPIPRETVTLPVAVLEACDRIRVRDRAPKAGSDVVTDYAEAYECGLIVEPLDVFNEPGTERYIVADGEHRLLALSRAGIKSVDVRLHQGDELAALDFAIGCNQAHGLQRTKADKYHAFVRIMETALRDKYRTDTALAEKIGVSLRTIANYKADWRKSEGGSKKAQRRKRKAAGSAKKHSSGTNLQLAGSETRMVEPKTDLSTVTTPRSTRQVTPEQERVVREVRDSVKRAWTAADEHGYALLNSAWRKASQAARERFLREKSP